MAEHTLILLRHSKSDWSGDEADVDRAYAASVSELLDIVRSLGEELGTVVLVGHNPGLEDLAETLLGDSVPLPTSALAVIELDGPWRRASRPPGLLRTAGRPPPS